jgi:G patch domain-containing protein 1
MDEEDLREAEEAKQLQTAEGFAGFGSTDEDSVRLGGLMDILKIGGETMGVKLLKRMGWREGQGIGPKVRRKAKVEDGDCSGDETHLFAPDNAPMVSFNRKTDYKGVGYESESRLVGAERTGSGTNTSGILDHDSDDDIGLNLISTKPKEKKNEGKRGGFGVGILNDTGSDDEDPYQIVPQILYNKAIGGDKKKKKGAENGKKITSTANPLLKSKPVFISKKTAGPKSMSGFRRCHDGRLPLDGFVLSSIAGNSSSIAGGVNKYSPPEIPKNWKSSKKPKKSRDISAYKSTAGAAKASSLDPKSRAALLGETQLPGKSVFDFMTPQARDRLATVTGKTNLPPALSEKAPKGFESTDQEKQRDLWSMVPTLGKDIAIEALGRGVSGWMPYAEDEDKRSRYRSYLEGQAGLQQGLPQRAPGVSSNDWAQELHEFAHAARMFKPMTGMMASRFTTSSSQPKLASDVPESSTEQPLLSKPAAKPEDPAEAAAKMGLYGPMTRSVQQFYPSRLLCKRFNVKPPAHVQTDPGETPEGPETTDLGGGGRFQSAGYQAGANSKLELVSKDVVNRLLLESGGSARMVEAASPPDREQVKETVIDPERNDALEGERPGEAVFKAIFGSDDEDDE